MFIVTDPRSQISNVENNIENLAITLSYDESITCRN